MIPGFLIWPTFLKVTEVKVQNWHVSLPFDLEHSNLGIIYLSTKFSAQLDFKYGRQVAILEKNKVEVYMT
jgi:hypothetical protein